MLLMDQRKWGMKLTTEFSNREVTGLIREVSVEWQEQELDWSGLKWLPRIWDKRLSEAASIGNSLNEFYYREKEKMKWEL